MRGISSFHFIAHQNHFSSHFKELCCAKSLIDLYNVNHNTDFVSLVANIVWLEVNMCCSSNVLMRTKHTRLILTIPCAVCPAVFFFRNRLIGSVQGNTMIRSTPPALCTGQNSTSLERGFTQEFFLPLQQCSSTFLRIVYQAVDYMSHHGVVYKYQPTQMILHAILPIFCQIIAENINLSTFARILTYIYMLRLHVITLLLFLLA